MVDLVCDGDQHLPSALSMRTSHASAGGMSRTNGLTALQLINVHKHKLHHSNMKLVVFIRQEKNDYGLLCAHADINRHDHGDHQYGTRQRKREGLRKR